MNIFKSKKIIAAALTFVMFMALTGLPLPAKERRGAAVEVTMTDGSQVKGELLAVKANALLVYDCAAGQAKSFDLLQVVQVKLLKKSYLLWRIITGIGIGWLIGNISKGQWPNPGNDEEMGNGLLLTAAGFIGGIIGTAVAESGRFAFDGTSPPTMQENLQRLKRHARENDAASNAQGPAVRSRRSIFHCLRLLWSPVLHMPSGNISSGGSNGTFRFVETGSSKDTNVYDFKFYVQKSYINKNNLRFRLEYEWTPHFSAGLEYISKAETSTGFSYYLDFDSADFNRQFYSGDHFSYSYDSLLLGLNWKPLSPSFTSKNVIELGLSAGPTRVRENQFNVLTLMAKVHAAYDHFYSDNLSLGGFIEFQHLSVHFPGVKYIETRTFYPKWIYGEKNHYENLERNTEITIPEHNIQLGGLAYGLRVGLRF